MKDIKIAQRFQPYSHIPGTSCLLPSSSFVVTVFPTLLRIHDLNSSKIIEIILHIQGPVEQFTVQSDLEHQQVRVWGFAPQGLVRYILKKQKNKWILVLEKAPLNSLQWSIKEQQGSLKIKEELFLVEDSEHYLGVIERLALGNHRAQDWDLIQRRLDLTEIFPIWYYLGQITPKTPMSGPACGTLRLLEECRLAVESPEKILDPFKKLFLAGFHDLLVPTLQDIKYQGLTLSEDVLATCSPLILLSATWPLMKRLFIHLENRTLTVLPLLPPTFHAGRLLNVQLLGGTADLEWTKKTIRRFIFRSSIDQEVSFCFKKVDSFRLKQKGRAGYRHLPVGTVLQLQKNCDYLFDNFA